MSGMERGMASCINFSFNEISPLIFRILTRRDLRSSKIDLVILRQSKEKVAVVPAWPATLRFSLEEIWNCESVLLWEDESLSVSIQYLNFYCAIIVRNSWSTSQTAVKRILNRRSYSQNWDFCWCRSSPRRGSSWPSHLSILPVYLTTVRCACLKKSGGPPVIMYKSTDSDCVSRMWWFAG